MSPEGAIFAGLFNNLAIAILLVALYGTLAARLRRSPPSLQPLVLGLAFGLFSIISMHAKIPVVEGVIVDQRNALVTLAGVFGGPPAAVVSGLIAAAYRNYLGGSGVLSGAVGCGLAALAGSLLPRLLGCMETVPRAAALSLAATVIILPGFLLVGDLAHGWRLLKAVTVPYGSAIFLGIFLIGLLLAREDRRQRAEDALRDALYDARRANRHKSIFLATMSHELRTPLNAIMGFSEIIRDQHLGVLPAKYSEYAADIHKSSRQLLALISDILDISSIEVGRRTLQKETVQLTEVLRNCGKAAQVTGSKREIAVSVDVEDPLPPVLADRRAVIQVVQNLLDNSLKFTPGGGSVILSARRRDRDVVMRVSDTGVGIRAEDLPHLMEPFARGDFNPYVASEGVGLGLSIVKKLVDAHDGQLGITSEPGKGTTVEVVFPGINPENQAARPVKAVLVDA